MISRAQIEYHASIGGRLPSKPRGPSLVSDRGWRYLGRDHWEKDFGDGWIADVWMVPATGPKRRWWTFQIVGPGDKTHVEPNALMGTPEKAKARASREAGILKARWRNGG